MVCTYPLPHDFSSHSFYPAVLKWGEQRGLGYEATNVHHTENEIIPHPPPPPQTNPNQPSLLNQCFSQQSQKVGGIVKI